MKIAIGSDQDSQKDQRIDYEHRAVALGEMCDAGRNQRDSEAEVSEFFNLQWDSRQQQRYNSQYFGDAEFDPEIIWQSQMSE